MNRIVLGLGASALLGLGACTEGPANSVDNFGYKGTGIAFGVSPLTLDALADACYSFAVVNASGDLVVGRGPGAVVAHSPLITGTATRTICASQFGNTAGGDISYVAPCDASQSPTDERLHTVTLWVDALCTGAVTNKSGTANYQTPDGICTEMQSYVNPCGSAGCDLDVLCVENADTPVTFNFTIMGQADQGFFDIAVNFDDVFCSAKLDDCNTTGAKINLIFDPTTGERINTIVAAVSCTGGPGDAVDTQLNLTSLNVGCTSDSSSGTLDFSTVGQEGNLTIGDYPGAVYYGTESLANVNKVYTTVAIGIDGRSGCWLEWDVVPSNGSFTASNATGVYTSYGFVHFEASGLGGPDGECHVNPLNGDGSGVVTGYANGTSSPAGDVNTVLGEDGATGTAGFESHSSCAQPCDASTVLASGYGTADNLCKSTVGTTCNLATFCCN